MRIRRDMGFLASAAEASEGFFRRLGGSVTTNIAFFSQPRHNPLKTLDSRVDKGPFSAVERVSNGAERVSNAIRTAPNALP